MTSMNKHYWMALCATSATLASSFTMNQMPASSSSPPLQRVQSVRTRTARPDQALSALIYGWDDGDDDVISTSSTPSYLAMDLDVPQCSPVGVEVAESLSYDQDRVGSLARLAVAFSPPERALTLDQIEKVDVICVQEDHIDIQAIICENGGCVSLSVPILFPYACDSNTEWMEGCVRKNLEELDESAKTTISVKDSSSNSHQQVIDSAPSMMDYPSWWVRSSEPAMVSECSNMRSILNENEFETEIKALAQDSVQRAHEETYVVDQAKVAEVGPAGIAFQVLASTGLSFQGQQALTVFYPFGAPPLTSNDKLRAAVLGAVATAEGRS